MNVKLTVFLLMALFALTSAIGGYRGYGGHPGYRSYGGYRGLRSYGGYGGFNRSKLYSRRAPALDKKVVQPVPVIKKVEEPVVKYMAVPDVQKVPVPITVPVNPKVHS